MNRSLLSMSFAPRRHRTQTAFMLPDPDLLSPRQCIQIDIAAGKNDANASTGEGDFPFQSGREGNGRGRFDDDLHRLPDRAHRFNNGFLTYRHYFVDVALDDFEVRRADIGAQ